MPMNKRLRIFVVETDGSGGLVHYIYQLCTALAAQGMDVTLVTASDYELADQPHNFHVVKLFRLWKRFDTEDAQNQSSIWVQRAKRIYRLFRRALRGLVLLINWMYLTLFLMRSKPDLIQFSRLTFRIDSIFIGILRRWGFVLTQICHEFEEREGQSRLEALLLGVGDQVYSNFSAMFFHAEENRKRFFSMYSTISPEKTHLIAHGNSNWLLNFASAAGTPQAMRTRYGLREEERVVLFFGLLAPSKGLDNLLDAFHLARDACEAKLLIAGYPTNYFDLAAFRARIVDLKLQGNVILDLRYVDLSEIGPIMSLASVVVYPYHSSTQSGAVQAAYTFGRAVIASRVGGLPEVVEDGRNGFLVTPGSARELADRISLLVNDPLMASTMGEHSRQLSNTRFDWKSIAVRIMEIYKDLIPGK
jgi:glycosyltransferase involved in cell wall biosynthesis